MQGYKVVQENNIWKFLLIPSNNKNQPVGWSKEFPSRCDCINGVESFRNLVISNNICSLDSPFLRLVYGEKGAYVEYCIDGEMLFRSREYFSPSHKNSCKKIVSSLRRHLDRYTLKEIDA